MLEECDDPALEDVSFTCDECLFAKNGECEFAYSPCCINGECVVRSLNEEGKLSKFCIDCGRILDSKDSLKRGRGDKCYIDHLEKQNKLLHASVEALHKALRSKKKGWRL